MSQSSLADWLTRLEGFSPHEIDLGLERVLAVLERLQLQLPSQVLHVAGTNGKGSSVALLQSLLATSHAKVGTYTSPHILRFNERIRLSGEEASDQTIIDAFARIDEVRGNTPLTYFEFGTIAALVIFASHQVDIAVLEVGMGGRLDAVNAVEPMAGLITNVSLDHCDWLGNDVEAIAVEKAGIMRSGKPTVFASPQVPLAIERRAVEIGADLVLAGRDYQWESSDKVWHWRGQTHELDGLALPSLSGPMQVVNAAGVLALLEAAGIDELLEAGTVNRAFSSVSLPGRMQSVRSDRHWLLDVAHNPAAAEALAISLNESDFGGQTIAIVGMLDDKDVAGLVLPLVHIVDKWIAVQASSPRAIAVDELARQVANASNRSCFEAQSVADAIEHARQVSTEDDRVLVTGSFYVVGPAFEALGLYSPR